MPQALPKWSATSHITFIFVFVHSVAFSVVCINEITGNSLANIYCWAWQSIYAKLKLWVSISKFDTFRLNIKLAGHLAKPAIIGYMYFFLHYENIFKGIRAKRQWTFH